MAMSLRDANRTARSLRIIFQAIAKEQRQNYQLNIDAATITQSHGRLKLSALHYLVIRRVAAESDCDAG